MIRIQPDRTKLALTKWLPISSVAAGITFVATFMLQIPQPQVIAATVMTGVLVFSGLAMRSLGPKSDDTP